jgi:hypothetical protein
MLLSRAAGTGLRRTDPFYNVLPPAGFRRTGAATQPGGIPCRGGKLPECPCDGREFRAIRGAAKGLAMADSVDRMAVSKASGETLTL